MPNSVTKADGLPDAKGKCEAQRNTGAKRSPKQPEQKPSKETNNDSPILIKKAPLLSKAY
jgi:hypothetical protein